MEEQNDAFEKMHSDATGVVGPLPTDNLPWLNNVEVVSEIVNEFAQTVLKNFELAESGADGYGLPQFQSWLDGECRAWNAVFIGGGLESRPFKTDPAWNNPDVLGHAILLSLHRDGENRFAVRDALGSLAVDLVTVADKRRGQPVSDWGWELDGLVQRTATALLGLPLDDAA